MTYNNDFALLKTLSSAEKEEIQAKTITKLTEIIGVEVDNVLAEYVLVMVGNKKKMSQIAHDLIDFIGEEAADQFAAWLGNVLPKYDEKSGAQKAVSVPAIEKKQKLQAAETDPAESEPVKAASDKTQDSESRKKEAEKRAAVGKSTVRTLNRNKNEVNMDQVLAKRSQRFGTADASSPTRKRRAATIVESGDKRKPARVTDLLGPPVNVDQAELDARDVMSTRKRKTTRSRSWNNGKEHPSARKMAKASKDESNKEMQHNGNRRDRKPLRSDEGEHKSQPPLPAEQSVDNDASRSHYNRNNRHQPDYRFPMGPNFGGFPPMPYGPPRPDMFFGGPGPCPPMPPYGMGYPMHMHQPGHGARFSDNSPFPPPPLAGGNGSGYYPKARPFQNKRWVNPETAKKEEKNESGNDEGAVTITYNAPQTSYYPAPAVRPRFQNKTWVRTDAQKEKDLSETLPQTPPQKTES